MCFVIHCPVVTDVPAVTEGSVQQSPRRDEVT